MNHIKIGVGVFATVAAFSLAALLVMTIRLAYGATTLAQVNGTVITLEDFNKKFQANAQLFQFKAPTKRTVLDEVIKRELAVQEAKKSGLQNDPDVIDRMNTVLYQALVEKKLGTQFNKIFINDDDAKKYYEKYPEVRTSHIFVGVPPGATKAQEKEAFDRIKKIEDQYLKKEKMGFAEAAQRFSEGPAAPMGGDIDYQTKDRLDPEYYDTALKLRTPGRVSGIVRSQFGYHIIKLTSIRPWRETDKAQIKRLVFEERRQQIFEQYMDGLRRGAKVSVNYNLLN